jgi:hypothetical protein
MAMMTGTVITSEKVERKSAQALTRPLDSLPDRKDEINFSA